MKKTGILYGFKTYFSSFRILFSNLSLIKYSVLPIIINIVFLILILYLGFSQYGKLMNYILPSQNIWWQAFLYWISWFIFPVVFLVLVFYTFISVACIISAPFLEILSEKFLTMVQGKDEYNSKTPFLTKMWEEAKKILALLFIALITFPVNFIPVIGNLLYYFISILLFSFEFLDYPMSIKAWSFKERYKFVFKNLLTSIGFGSAISISFIIPVIGFFCLPASTIGATKIFFDQTEANK